MNAMLKFTKRMTRYNPALQRKVVSLYKSFFESGDDPFYDEEIPGNSVIPGKDETTASGADTSKVLEKLRSKVGNEKPAESGDDVFNLANDMGYEDGKKNPEAAANDEDAIEAGVIEGDLSDFGTAIPSDSTMPTEEDLGFGTEDTTAGVGEDPLGAMDDGLGDETELGGETELGDESTDEAFDDGGMEDLGVDGADDEFEQL